MFTEIVKNGKISVFWATKATVNHFFDDFHCNIYVRKSFGEKKMEKPLMTFLLLFNRLKFDKTLLFCCNGYSHVILHFCYESQVE